MGRPRKTDQGEQLKVATQLSPEFTKVVEAYINSHRPAITISSLLRVSLEDFMEKKGLWSPQEAK